MDNAIITLLDQFGINYKLYHHIAVFTVEEANKIDSKIEAFHTKNLFLTDKKGWHHLVCIGAHHRLKIKDFARAYGLKDLSFGSMEDLTHELHTTPGSVSVFGMMYQTNTKLYLDPDIIDQPAIGRHPNDNTSTVVISYGELRNFLRTINITPTKLKSDIL